MGAQRRCHISRNGGIAAPPSMAAPLSPPPAPCSRSAVATNAAAAAGDQPHALFERADHQVAAAGVVAASARFSASL
jgi:hypothetical protein